MVYNTFSFTSNVTLEAKIRASPLHDPELQPIMRALKKNLLKSVIIITVIIIYSKSTII